MMDDCEACNNMTIFNHSECYNTAVCHCVGLCIPLVTHINVEFMLVVIRYHTCTLLLGKVYWFFSISDIQEVFASLHVNYVVVSISRCK